MRSAVQLMPPGKTPVGWDRIESTLLKSQDVEAILRAVPTAAGPLGDQSDEDEGFRISIAGAQEKTALLRIGNTWHRPVGATPTTHILKLPLGIVGGGLQLKICLIRSTTNGSLRGFVRSHALTRRTHSDRDVRRSACTRGRALRSSLAQCRHARSDSGAIPCATQCLDRTTSSGGFLPGNREAARGEVREGRWPGNGSNPANSRSRSSPRARQQPLYAFAADVLVLSRHGRTRQKLLHIPPSRRLRANAILRFTIRVAGHRKQSPSVAAAESQNGDGDAHWESTPLPVERDSASPFQGAHRLSCRTLNCGR